MKINYTNSEMTHEIIEQERREQEGFSVCQALNHNAELLEPWATQELQAEIDRRRALVLDRDGFVGMED